MEEIELTKEDEEYLTKKFRDFKEKSKGMNERDKTRLYKRMVTKEGNKIRKKYGKGEI